MSNTEQYEIDDLAMGTHDGRDKRVKKGWLASSLDLVFSCAVCILSGIFVFWSFSAEGAVLFAWHPTLTSLGFILFMSQAILIYSSPTIMGQDKKSYTNRVWVHLIMQSIAMVSITAGIAAIFYNKVRLGKPHYQSPHAIMGLITYILLILGTCGGIAAKYSFQLRRKIRPVVVKVGHSAFGLFVFWFGGTTLVLGLFTKWFERHRTKTDLYFTFAAILVIWTYTSLRPLGQIVRRLKQMCTSI